MNNECKYLIVDDVSGPYDHPDYRYKCALGCDMLSPKITCRHCKIDEKSKILKSMYYHWDEATKLFNINNIVMLSLQGSQNYNLETETSDVDTKLLITPTMNDIDYRGKTLGTQKDWCDADLIEVWYCRALNGYMIYPEHNEEYLQECLDNLKGKGINIEP